MTLSAAYPFHWSVFYGYLFHPSSLVVHGIELTIVIAVVSEAFGIVLGTILALFRMSRFRPIRWLVGFYIWFFRGTPLLVQIAVVYFAGAPFFGLAVFGGYKWDDVHVFGWVIAGRVLAGMFALAVNEGAYIAEIMRGGIESVDSGQMEAAKAVGMMPTLALRRVILPQALRAVIPTLGNQFNMMLKTTSLLSAISVVELYTAASIIEGQDFEPFEIFFAAAIYYLAMTSIWSLIQARIEAHFARGWVAGDTAWLSRLARVRFSGS